DRRTFRGGKHIHAHVIRFDTEGRRLILSEYVVSAFERTGKRRDDEREDETEVAGATAFARLAEPNLTRWLHERRLTEIAGHVQRSVYTTGPCASMRSMSRRTSRITESRSSSVSPLVSTGRPTRMLTVAGRLIQLP